MLSSSDIICRGLNAATIWSRPFEIYICIYIVIWHPNSYGYNYHHMRRICHDILFPNFLRHQSQCFQNCLWLNLWIYDNLAIQTHFFGHLSKYACGIHLTERFHAWRNVLQNEMHPREWHANINVYPPSMSFYFPDFVSVIVTGWQDFAASLTEKCQSAMFITVLSTNYMPHKKGPYTSHNTWKVCITEWLRFYSILSIFSTHFQIFFTAVVNNWLYLFNTCIGLTV